MEKQKKPSLVKRLLPLAVLVAVFAIIIINGWHKQFTFENIRENRDYLRALVSDWGILALAVYVGVYIVVTALSIPGAIYLTISGGFLFGVAQGSLATVIGASIGASIIFMAVKFGLASSLSKNAGGFIAKMEEGFKKNAFSFLLVLRILPVFPFWLVNIVPALLNVKLKIFFWATFFGIIPGTVVFNSIGDGLGAVFDSGETPDLSIIYQPKILAPLFGLAVLSIIPIFKDKILSYFDKKDSK